MANSRFAALVADKLKGTKSLATILPSNGRLELGEHKVTVAAVDTSNAATDMLKITYANDAGATQQSSVFLMNKDGNGLSITASQLLETFVVDRNNFVPFLDWAAADASAWEVFTGLSCVITIEQAKKGYITKVDGIGHFAAYDIATGDKVTEDFATVQEARDAAKANGLKPAYANVNRIKAPEDATTNAAVVAKALAERGGVSSEFATK